MPPQANIKKAISTQNGSISIDYTAMKEATAVIALAATNNILQAIADNATNGINFPPIATNAQISVGFGTAHHIDLFGLQSGTPCEGKGYYYATLSDRGLITSYLCWGGIQGIQPTTDDYNNWLNGNELHIKWNALQNGSATIQLYDLLGRKLMETTTEVNNQQCLTYLSDFPASLYLIKVTQKNIQHGGKLLWMKN